MGKYPHHFEELLAILRSLPGVGKRTAERMAFAMMKWPSEKLESAGQLILSLRDNVLECPECGNLSPTQAEKCVICSSPSRNSGIICIVEDVSQLGSIEACGAYRGLYHVLHGKIIPLDGKELANQSIEKLKSRISRGQVSELIIALGMDVEGQATAIYLSELFGNDNLKISRIARGLPIGSDIAFADPDTIVAAFQGRTNINKY
jgi:recombination protein RecR